MTVLTLTYFEAGYPFVVLCIHKAVALAPLPRQIILELLIVTPVNWSLLKINHMPECLRGGTFVTRGVYHFNSLRNK
jgi:hypothetical protein